MNLPHPFGNASDVQTDAHGSISLIDSQGKSLARLPINTAFDLSPEVEGCGHGDHGYGYGFGSGYGDDVGDGSGRGNDK